jgi:hypothetical protein
VQAYDLLHRELLLFGNALQVRAVLAAVNHRDAELAGGTGAGTGEFELAQAQQHEGPYLPGRGGAGVEFHEQGVVCGHRAMDAVGTGSVQPPGEGVDGGPVGLPVR